MKLTRGTMMVGPVTYSIGEAARTSELSVKAIRYYEEISLIPKAGRSNGAARTSDHRRYSSADIGRLRFIHRARLLGLALAEIRQMLVVAEGGGCPGRRPEYQQVLKNHLREIDQRIRHFKALRVAIAELTTARQRTRDDVCTWDRCGCLMSMQRAPTSKLVRQQALECKEGTMCNLCGCNTVRSSARRVAKGKPLDVPIVAVAKAPQMHHPTPGTRPSLGRAPAKQSKRTAA
ncbi:MAG: MerR family DNA-binding protein [Casimicrobiaceae bacterium]